ncbi:MAG TPA: hypothetical protein VMS17_10570 [Gemmataceae bacterium]|nr:hypothetical protein [Gemmataceae bacterium]
MTAELMQERPIAAWMQVLEIIEEALARRLAEVEDPPPAVGDVGSPAQTLLQALDERLTVMQGRLDQAERDAAEADDPLRTETEAYQRWTETMTAARRRFADWAASLR